MLIQYQQDPSGSAEGRRGVLEAVLIQTPGATIMAMARRELRALLGRSDNDNRAMVEPALSLRPAIPVVSAETLELTYPHLATRAEPGLGVLWAWMRHPERACFTPGLMADGRHFQLWLKAAFKGLGVEAMPFRYLVWGSQAQGAWSMGGDLSTFTSLIRRQDVASLRAYAQHSVDVLYDNYDGLGLPILTCALIQGDAVGGGFEAMLTNDIVVAEAGTRFGLPEVLFNLFPGMGAMSFLKRKVGMRVARQLVEDGRTRTAEEMHELGLVDVVADKGQGEAALRATLAERAQRFRTELTLKAVRRRCDPLDKAELDDVVEMWVQLALTLTESDLRRMDCLGRHQERRRARAA
jgi:DSF synthase